MSKYIVKNCPSFIEDTQECESEQSHFIWCEDCTDCLIKQVIEKCKKKKEWFSKSPDGVAFDLNAFMGGNLQDEILQLFEIEECE